MQMDLSRDSESLSGALTRLPFHSLIRSLVASFQAQLAFFLPLAEVEQQLASEFRLSTVPARAASVFFEVANRDRKSRFLDPRVS
jgi:hypothetical protein